METKAEILAGFEVWWASMHPMFCATVDKQACYLAYIAGAMQGLDIAKRAFIEEMMP